MLRGGTLDVKSLHVLVGMDDALYKYVYYMYNRNAL